MSQLNLLEVLLKESQEAFCEASLLKIEKLVSDKFSFQMHFERGGQKWLSAGGKKEFLEIYKELFGRGQTFSNWNYTVIDYKKTVFGRVKATLLFSCVAHMPNFPDREEKHIEKIECVAGSYGLRLLKI